MIKAKTLDLILRTFKVFNGFDGPGSDSLFWRTDGEYAPVTLIVNCNDLFWWATADGETITEDNIGLLEQTYQDLKNVDPEDHYGAKNADILFCCRVRGMRPQSPYYQYIDKKLHHLFDACGPVRDPKDEG